MAGQVSAGADATRALSDSALWIRELEAGGWTRLGTSGTVWRSPDGQYYRGPFGAWRVMHGALLPEPLGSTTAFAARVMMLASVVENAGVEIVIGLRADEQADLREAAALLRRLAAAPANDRETLARCLVETLPPTMIYHHIHTEYVVNEVHEPDTWKPVCKCGWSGQEWAASENAVREGYEHASAGLTDRLLAALGRARPEPEEKR